MRYPFAGRTKHSIFDEIDTFDFPNIRWGAFVKMWKPLYWLRSEFFVDRVYNWVDNTYTVLESLYFSGSRVALPSRTFFQIICWRDGGSNLNNTIPNAVNVTLVLVLHLSAQPSTVGDQCLKFLCHCNLSVVTVYGGGKKCCRTALPAALIYVNVVASSSGGRRQDHQMTVKNFDNLIG